MSAPDDTSPGESDVPATPDATPDTTTPAPASEPAVEEVSIRRAPKLGVFLIVGGMLGALVTLILTSLFPVDPNIGFAATFGYFCLYGVPFGVAVGALIGLGFDRRSTRKARTVTVEHHRTD